MTNQATQAAIATLLKASVALGKRGAALLEYRQEVADALGALCDTADDDAIKEYKATVRIGYMVGYTGDAASKVKAWLNDKDITKRITDRASATTYQLAYAAASTELSRIVELAGLEKQKRGAATPEARAKREAAKAAANAVTAQLNADGEIINMPAASSGGVTLASLDDVVAKLDETAKQIASLQKAASAAKLLDGDEGMKVRDAIAAILNAVKAAHGPAAPKAERAPRKAKAPEAQAA